MRFDHYWAKKKNNEFEYCLKIFALFYACGLNFRAEEYGSIGRSDFTVNYDDQAWVIEVKLRRDDQDDEKLANSALEQIKNRNYGGGYSQPLLLALRFNNEKRSVTSWKGMTYLSLSPKLNRQDLKTSRTRTRALDQGCGPYQK
ncbi:MAG: PD-(D/E)XK nuclease domain-containing protein [Deltaproteobacteria bacterium]|nr:PD-(D/E)XK nuclease domain-containing protein [Deltaproteobacteria bacterium]